MNFVTQENVDRARDALQSRGCLLLEGIYSRSQCEEIVGWIDATSAEPGLERNYAGSEVRIWHAESRHPGLQDFQARCAAFLSELAGRAPKDQNLLAIRNEALRSPSGEVTLGRWHIDSFFRQYKIFLFLTDVDEDSGPFEFLPGTHRPAFKAAMAARGRYLGPSDFLRGRSRREGGRRYEKLDDEWIRQLALRGRTAVPVLCPAGTLMVVNTSAIHRARPCRRGARYALASYFV